VHIDIYLELIGECVGVSVIFGHIDISEDYFSILTCGPNLANRVLIDQILILYVYV